MPDQEYHRVRAAHLASLAAALMGLGKPLDASSRMLSGAALIVLAFKPGTPAVWMALALVMVFGAIELGYALRCALDAPLFASWARRWYGSEGSPQEDLAAFDLTLQDSGLRPATTPPRVLSERIAGARHLLRRQGQCLALQAGAWLTALVLLFLF